MNRAYARSARLAAEAREYIPGGINTSIRKLDPPLIFDRAEGARLWDADGNEYVDYHAAFGPIVLGHCHPKVDARVAETIRRLDLIGAGATELEIEAARKICQHVPSAERVQFCNSGSEATYNAVRLSRAVTGRKKIVKFQGCYHGWHDYLAMNVISPREKIGRHDPLSAGMLPEAIENTIVLTFNSVEELEETFRRQAGEIAAVILEPVPHNIGCVLPEQPFLAALRELTRRHRSLLIFDEVITGFRHGLGGYQKVCGVTPDLTTLAKSIANGYPCAALCGRRDYMERLATAGGDVFFAGTYNAHPLAMAAVLATIAELEDGSVHRHIFALGEKARKGLEDLLLRSGASASVAGFGSVFVVYFREPGVRNFTGLLENDMGADAAFRRGLVERGSFVLPLALKRGHISAAHTVADIDLLLEHAEAALKTTLQGAPALSAR
ncbi:MAG: aspartate aminotransferase family protein [Acidobacteria bacterium]|nr:aspartate aminotransferase family protein [Acidobacteriota bacterium]